MPKRSLAVLATLALVAPLSAHAASYDAPHKAQNNTSCPHARKQQAAAATRQWAATPRPRAIAAPVSSAGESSLFGFGRGASVLMP
jgi:hypothetical protein